MVYCSCTYNTTNLPLYSTTGLLADMCWADEEVLAETATGGLFSQSCFSYFDVVFSLHLLYISWLNTIIHSK